MPEGRRVMIGARVSEAVAAAVDEVRGDVPRSAWVEAAIRNALAEAGASPGLPVKVIADKRVPRGVAAVVSPGAEPVFITNLPSRSNRSREACPHPKSRVLKGFCGACGTGGLG